MDNLYKGFHNDRKTVCVQGLGFVGSAMALAWQLQMRGIEKDICYTM